MKPDRADKIVCFIRLHLLARPSVLFLLSIVLCRKRERRYIEPGLLLIILKLVVLLNFRLLISKLLPFFLFSNLYPVKVDTDFFNRHDFTFDSLKIKKKFKLLTNFQTKYIVTLGKLAAIAARVMECKKDKSEGGEKIL